MPLGKNHPKDCNCKFCTHRIITVIAKEKRRNRTNGIHKYPVIYIE